MYTDFNYLERNLLSEDVQVHCHLVGTNEFIDFTNVVFEDCQNYIIDNKDKIYRFRYKAVTRLNSDSEEEDSAIA